MDLICNDIKIKMAAIVGGLLYGKLLKRKYFPMLEVNNQYKSLVKCTEYQIFITSGLIKPAKNLEK